MNVSAKHSLTVQPDCSFLLKSLNMYQLSLAYIPLPAIIQFSYRSVQEKETVWPWIWQHYEISGTTHPMTKHYIPEHLHYHITSVHLEFNNNSTYNWACRALTQGNYTHHHNQAANTVHPELAIRYGLSKGPPMLYHEYEPQSILENSTCKLYHDRSIITD